MPLSPWRATVKQVNNAFQKELDASGADLGYCRTCASLKKNKKILVRQEDVRKISFELIAEGVQHRKRKKLVRQKYRNPGLSHVWHIDGHDKLKPFDFSVFKCIDGFSRKRNWLEVTSSNKVPEIISQCYLKAIERLKGAPNNECRSWY